MDESKCVTHTVHDGSIFPQHCDLLPDLQRQDGHGLGVERQEQDCRELGARLGWTVVEVFADNDLSAYSGKRRPRYRAMLEAMPAGRIGAVLAWHTDRLHRSPIELEEYIAACNDGRDVPTHTVQAGPLDLSSPSGRMVARQLGAVARYESEHRSERVRRAFFAECAAGSPCWWAAPVRL